MSYADQRPALVFGRLTGDAIAPPVRGLLVASLMLAGSAPARADIITGGLTLGDSGVEIVTQSEDDRRITGFLVVGNGSTYTLIGHTLRSTNQDIGFPGTGTFNQFGGLNTVFGSSESTIFLGLFRDDTGIYNLNGGTVSVAPTADGRLNVGHNGTGTFNHNFGTVNVFDVFIGRNGDDDRPPGAQGQYNLTSGDLNVTDDLRVGRGGVGKFLQTGDTSTVSVGDDLDLALNGGSSGEYKLQGGSVTVGGDLAVGANGTGKFFQSAGTTLNVTGSLDLGDDDPEANGEFTFNGGTLNVGGAQIGDEGIGVFKHNGGNHAVTGTLFIGQEETGVGTYNFAEGGLTAASLSIGRDGKGTFVQESGTTTKVTGLLLLGSANDTFTLKDGSLETGQIVNSGTMKFQNGTVKLTGGDFNNQGTVELDSENVPTITGPGTFINKGKLKVNGDTTLGMGFTLADGGSIEVANGTLTLPGNTGGPPGAQSFGTHTGTNTIQLGVGGILDLTDTHTFNGNVTVTGGSTAEFKFKKLVISSPTDPKLFRVKVGTSDNPNPGFQFLAGDEILALDEGVFVNQGAMTVNGGVLESDSIFSTAMLNETGAKLQIRNMKIRKGQLKNSGFINGGGAAPLLTLDNAELFNLAGGTMDLTGNFKIVGSAIGALEGEGSRLFNNGGTLLKSDAGTAEIEVPFELSSGKIRLQAGTTRFNDRFVADIFISLKNIQIDRGAVLELTQGPGSDGDAFSPSTTILGKGIFRTKGFTVDNSTIATGTAVILNMTDGGKAIINGSVLAPINSRTLNQGLVEWQAGTLDTFTNEGQLVTMNSGPPCAGCRVLGQNFLNTGTLDISAGTEVFVSKAKGDSTLVTNQGTVNLKGVLKPQFADTGVRFLNDNAGVFNVLAPGETRNFAGIFDNKGTLEVGANTRFNLLNTVQPNFSFVSPTNSSLVLNGGTWIIQNGAELVLQNSTAHVERNDGAVLLHGTGKFSAFSNNATGLAETFTNAGIFRLASNAVYTAKGLFENAGNLIIDVGSKLDVIGTFRTTADSTTALSGDLVVRGEFGGITGKFVNGGMFLGDGTLTVNGVENFGVWAPGFSPAIMTIGGDFTNAVDGSLEIEIAGLTAGTEYDRLVVEGTALLELGSTIDVIRLDPADFSPTGNLFLPSLGDVFDIIVADEILLGDGVSDLLSLFALPTLTNGLFFDLSIADFGSDRQSLRLFVDGDEVSASEPGTVLILVGGLLLLLFYRRRRLVPAFR